MVKLIFEFIVCFYNGQMCLRELDSYDDENEIIQIGSIQDHPIFLYEDEIRILDYHKFTNLKYLCKVDGKYLVEFKDDVKIELCNGDDVTTLSFGNVAIFDF